MRESKAPGTDRRGFLKGAALVGAGVAATGLAAACTPSTPTEGKSTSPAASGGDGATGYVKAHWTWEDVPEPITDAEDGGSADVIVVGLGNAGVHTSLSCVENGLSVIALEKSEWVQARGGSTGSNESHLHREADLHVNRDRAQYLWVRSSGNRVNEELVQLWFDRSGEALDWMWANVQHVDPGATQGLISAWGKFEWFPEEPDNCSTAASFDFEVPEEVYAIEFEGGFKFFYMPTAAHFKILKEEHTDKFTANFNTRVVQLVKEGDRVTGVITEDESGAHKKYTGTKAVVLATGGIHDDPEMMECYVEEFTANALDNQFAPPGFSTGDGHKMALWIGAALQGKPFPPMLHPQALAIFHGPFMFVNTKGRRYMNEATWVQGKAVQFMLQPKGFSYSIFDDNYDRDNADSLNYGGGMFWDSLSGVQGVPFDREAMRAEIEGYITNGVGFKADTLEELADLIGEIDKEAFLAQVAQYNADCEAGKDSQFCKDPRMLYPIAQAPFYAMRNGGTMMSIVGGIKMNKRLECLDTNGEVIPGLYAAGNVSGDLYAQDYPIHVSGTSTGRCLTWGYLLGKYISGAE
ncbi:MAG: FAD-binding protein [Bifidobacteriaceae bacterium]|jgi:succinate dehydrogenase/fumarate reductase flavoprotein subunit|nr:FAD-binding protein [Bifidobacteriaceae bacterium]